MDDDLQSIIKTLIMGELYNFYMSVMNQTCY